jgi:hypothetical protein
VQAHHNTPLSNKAVIDGVNNTIVESTQYSTMTIIYNRKRNEIYKDLIKIVCLLDELCGRYANEYIVTRGISLIGMSLHSCRMI